MSKDKRLSIIGLLALIMAAVSIPEVSATTPGTRVRIEPADLVVGLKGTFVIQVVIEEANNLGAFQFNLVYEPSIVQVTKAALGAFLESTGNSAVTMGPEVNNADGRVSFGAVSFGSAAGPSGTGVLATITCIAQGEGSTALELQKVQVLDTAANPQLVTAEGSQVVVRDTETPTPTARATSALAATATPMPTNTPEAVDTPPPPATTLPSPTPIVTSPAAETSTETPLPSPSPMPSVSIAPTEKRPTEVTTPPTVPTMESTQAPVAVAATSTSPLPTPPPPPSLLTPMPPPTPISSPTPVATIPVPAATGPSGWAVVGLMLAALAVAILVVFILSRRLGRRRL